MLTFVVVGPVMRTLGDWIAYGLAWLYESLGFIGGAIFGLLYAPITITGMHHSFSAIETQLIAAAETTGGSFIFPTASMNNVAQGAAVLAVLMMTKNEKLKSICSASGISALLGITEPAMFGVTLKLKYPFYAAIIGSAVGAAWCAGTRTLALALGAAGLPGFISIAPQSWGNFFIGIALSMVTSFALTVYFMKKHPEGADDSASGAGLKGMFKKNKKDDAAAIIEGPAASVAVDSQDANAVHAPFNGVVKPISECKDSVFASKAMGDGIVIVPENGNLYSPVTGEVMMVFPTKHAMGLKADNGAELLIHVGMDTVSLESKPFEVLVKEGDHIDAGQLLMKADLDAIKDAGLSIETPVVITNQKAFNSEKDGNVQAGETILRID